MWNDILLSLSHSFHLFFTFIMVVLCVFFNFFVLILFFVFLCNFGIMKLLSFDSNFIHIYFAFMFIDYLEFCYLMIFENEMNVNGMLMLFAFISFIFCNRYIVLIIFVCDFLFVWLIIFIMKLLSFDCNFMHILYLFVYYLML